MHMSALRKFGRLFVIKTRLEAWLITYAIALGAVERGRMYLDTYQGVGGWLLALACTGVVFIAGAKLLDSVKRPAAASARNMPPARRRELPIRSRPRLRRTRSGSGSRLSSRKD